MRSERKKVRTFDEVIEYIKSKYREEFLNSISEDIVRYVDFLAGMREGDMIREHSHGLSLDDFLITDEGRRIALEVRKKIYKNPNLA